MFLRFFLPIIQLVQSTKFNNHAFKLSFVAIGHLVKIDAVYTNLLALALVYTCVEMVHPKDGLPCLAWPDLPVARVMSQSRSSLDRFHTK